jgi:hypothetical protein
MAQERLIIAIGRIERALSRLEQAGFSYDSSPKSGSIPLDTALFEKHERLKTETRLAIRDIDALIREGTR